MPDLERKLDTKIEYGRTSIINYDRKRITPTVPNVTPAAVSPIKKVTFPDNVLRGRCGIDVVVPVTKYHNYQMPMTVVSDRPLYTHRSVQNCFGSMLKNMIELKSDLSRVSTELKWLKSR